MVTLNPNRTMDYYFTEPDIFKDPTTNKFIVFLTFIDILCRLFAFLLYVFYFVAVFLIKDLQRISLIFVHHVNFVNCIFCVHYLFYIVNLHPTFDDQILNQVLCRISETLWAVIRYARLFAMLAVAIYRWIAVYKVNLYKKITISYSILLAQVAFTWIISIILFIATKFAFNTTYGQLYCFDGFSDYTIDSIRYYVVTSVLGTLIPTVLVILIYILISHKLHTLSKKLNKTSSNTSSKIKSKTNTSRKTTSNKSTSKRDDQEFSVNNTIVYNTNIAGPSIIGNNTIGASFRINKTVEEKSNVEESDNKTKLKLDPSRIIAPVDLKKFYTKYIIKLDETKRKSETKFANQFLIINLSVIVSSITILIISIRNIVNLAPYFAKYYYLTQFVRILNMVSISVIPFASLMYHQSFRKWFKLKFSKKQIDPVDKPC